MPGEVPLALGHYEDAVLVAAARFIRRYHDATARLSDDGKVICHNDLSPCNFTFRDGLPVALIDFDLAAAGERLFDLGYAAWLWLDLGNEEIAIEEQRRRLVLFSDAYDPTVSPADLIDAALVRQKLLIDTYFGPVSDETREWAVHCHAFTLALTDRSSGAAEPSLK